MISKTIKLHVDRMQLPPAFVVAVAVFVVAAGISAIGQLTSSQAGAAAVPTPALPVVIFATAQPQLPSPEPAAMVALALPRFVVAYDQPVNGAVLGPIPAPDASAVVARYGSGWVMVPWDGGHVWLRASDAGLPDVVDIAPTLAPEVVYVAAQPVQAAPAPVYEPVSAPPVVEVAPAPTAAPVVRAVDFAQPDPKAKCQFIGCL
jgi:hypothetical protein